MHRMLGIALAALLGAGAAQAGVVSFATLEKGKNYASFESRNTLETILGSTMAVTAKIDADDADLTKSKVTVEVDLASLKTGIDMRDDHMRGENWLNTAKFPKAVFESTKVESDKKSVKSGETVELKCHGKFTLHGVTKEMTIPVSVTYVQGTEETAKAVAPGDILHAVASFSVRLTDFGMAVPQMLVLKVANEINCKLDVVAVAPKK